MPVKDGWAGYNLEAHHALTEQQTGGQSHLKNLSSVTKDVFIIQLIFPLTTCINTSHIIRRTGDKIKIDRNNAFSGMKFNTEEAKI